jgi:hypothetical protein
MMRSKQLFQAFVMLVVLFSAMGDPPRAYAQEQDPVIVMRDLTYVDATYTGSVTNTRFERWPLQLTVAQNFSVTAVSTTAYGPIFLVILLDANGGEITSAPGTLTTFQSAGLYFVQIQPYTVEGSYTVFFRPEAGEPPLPRASIIIDPSTIYKGETAVVSVDLENIPAEGYTSAEITCTYNPEKVELVVDSITITDLFFGHDPVSVKKIERGSFILAIARNGNDALPVGLEGAIQALSLNQQGQFITYARSPTTVFTIDARSPTNTLLPQATGDKVLTYNNSVLQEVVVATITCKVRVSEGNNVLIDLGSISADLNIIIDPPLLGTLKGQVLADKPVTVSVKDIEDVTVASAITDADGHFTIEVEAGTYTVVATASGFLSAKGTAIIIANQTTIKSTVELLAGDITGDDIIDEWDAMTIGMSYNTAEPTAADLNNDGVINVLDLELLAANYLKTGPINWQ